MLFWYEPDLSRTAGFRNAFFVVIQSVSLRFERRGSGKCMPRCASGASMLLGRRPGYRGILLVILGRRLECHRVDSGADNGNNHCFMALMSGAKVFVNDERLLRSSP